MQINTNMAAINAWRALENNQSNLQSSLQRLSSGQRINNAADDAAGLAVSEKMTAQTRGLTMATRNTQDAVSLVQTADGGANSIEDMLQRMRELSVQAGSDTLSNDDRSQLQEEFSSLQSEIDRTAGSVQFNGRKLINGDSSGATASIEAGAVGISSASVTGAAATLSTRALTVTVTTAGVDQQQTAAVADDTKMDATGGFGAAFDNQTITFTQGTGPSAKTLSINTAAIDASTGTAVSADSATQFAAYVTSQAAANGMTMSMSYTPGSSPAGTLTLDSGDASTGSDITVNAGTTGLSFSQSVASKNIALTVTDSVTGGTLTQGTDFTVDGQGNVAGAGSTYAGLSFKVANNVTTTGKVDITSKSLTFQVGANAGDTITGALGNLTASALNVSSLSIGTKSGATSALTTLDSAISTVSTERAKMGAMQNRLENTISTLQTQNENLTAANSRIKDVDMASEMANFTKFQVLSQASTAMLAQANQLPQGILSLLR